LALQEEGWSAWVAKKPTSLQRKTRKTIDEVTGKTVSQEYNFNPETGKETPVGDSYTSKLPAGVTVTTDSEGNATFQQGPITKQKVLPATQAGQLGEFQIYQDTMKEILDMVNKGTIDVGPFEFIRKRLDDWGIAPRKERIELRALVARTLGIMYAMRGKQLSDKEIEVAQDMMPKMKQSDVAFGVAARKFNDYLINVLKGKIDAYEKAGYVTGQRGDGTDSRPPLDSFIQP
jgi:hypothetical protein